MSAESDTPSVADGTFQVVLGSLASDSLEILRRGLSVGSVISLGAPFAAANQALDQSEGQTLFRAIGAGTCGTVFEWRGTSFVLKRAKPGYEDALWNDYVQHKLITESFHEHASIIGDLRLPKVIGYIRSTEHQFWTEKGSLFPEEYRAPCGLYMTGRILPLPHVIRFALIAIFFPDELKESAKASAGNRDCLVRLYLGRRRDPERRKPARATLRNYNLCLDQMEELGLETRVFAATMGRSLAVMHWSVGTDADDVEYVLGGEVGTLTESPMTGMELQQSKYPLTTLDLSSLNFHHRTVNMWLLDFNRCKRITVETKDERDKAISMVVGSFFRNDPYYPRPLSSNELENELWETFYKSYLWAGSKLLDEKEPGIRELPRRFLKAVEAEMKTRIARKIAAEARLAAMGIED